MKNNAYIQVGDKPGWSKPVLNIMIGGETFSIRITQKDKKRMVALNVATEG